MTAILTEVSGLCWGLGAHIRRGRRNELLSRESLFESTGTASQALRTLLYVLRGSEQCHSTTARQYECECKESCAVRTHDSLHECFFLESMKNCASERDCTRAASFRVTARLVYTFPTPVNRYWTGSRIGTDHKQLPRPPHQRHHPRRAHRWCRCPAAAA